MDLNEQKAAAAARAAEMVENGMRLGLGTGSTAALFVDEIGRLVAGGLDVICVPTSEATRAQAEALSIPLTTLDDTPFLDLTVDGADELDDQLCLIKGGGGALLREKIVASASDRMVVIADASKHVKTLGAFPLPVEAVRFGLAATRDLVEVLAAEAGCEGKISIRTEVNDQPFLTDSGNVILDCAFGSIPNAEALEDALKLIPGVVETGLFIDIADAAIVAGPNGITFLEAEDEEPEV